jgi:hypothetical protein
MTNPDAFRKAQAILDNALSEYARENGDGFSGRDWLGATEYQDEGFALAELAVALAIPEEDLQDWLEDKREPFPASARYLIAVASDYRLIELADAPKPKRTDWLAVAGDITGVV